MNKLNHGIYIAVIILLFSWGASRSAAPEGGFVEVPEPDPVKDMARETLECKPVVIIKKQDVEKEYTLPADVSSSEAMEVTAIGEIAPYEGTTLVTAIYNSTSGTTRLLSRREPVPFFGLPNDFSLGMRYGLSASAFEIYADWQPVRLGKWYAGLYAEANNDGEALAMATVERKF